MNTGNNKVGTAWCSLPLVLATAGWLLASVMPASAADFDWRNANVDGVWGDYTTPVRNQGSCGSCWAFAAVGALEAKLDITQVDPGADVDVSEQHLICDGTCGDCNGGSDSCALNFQRTTGLVSEAELPYEAANTSPDWPLQPGWQDRVYKHNGNQNRLTCTTENLKSSLQEYGPLVCGMQANDDWYWPTGSGGSTEAPEGFEDGVLKTGINHAALITGYQDDPDLTEGGYWVIKNSWGTGWGDDGYGYILYGDVEQHNSVHAITGDAFYVPEPATLALLAVGGLGVLLRRRG